MDNIAKIISQEILTTIGYKLEVVPIISDVVYEIKITNSMQEGYFNKPIPCKELQQIIFNGKDTKEIFKNLRRYAKS